MFFSGGGRREILDELIRGAEEATVLFTLVGDEGVGKSMICRRFEAEAGGEIVPVYFPQPVESFEDVVRETARHLGKEIDSVTKANGADCFREMIDTLELTGRRLFLIFDEAEKLYLATLERIRRQLEVENLDRLRMQVLFSGRTGLLENLDQLDVVEFEPVSKMDLILHPLDEQDTFSYLNHCSRYLSEYEGSDVFSAEAAQKIFQMGRGNIRRINIFAEDALKSVGKDTSFLVLLDNVEGDDDDDTFEESGSGLFPYPVASLLRDRRVQVVGGVLCLLFLLILFSGGDNEQTADEVTSDFKEPLQEQVIEKAPEISVEHVQPVPVETETKEPDIVVLTDENNTKKLVVIQEPAIQEPAEQETVAAETETTAPVSDARRLFVARLAAGSTWVTGASQGKYTIQLMVLSAEQGEENLQRMLSEKPYADIVNQLYILRRTASVDPLVLVYYGVYASMADARNARNTMPRFLREHHPYAISIKGAVDKVKGP